MKLYAEVVIYLLVLINMVILVMCGHLVMFHVYIQVRGITTFEYIIYNREKKIKET